MDGRYPKGRGRPGPAHGEAVTDAPAQDPTGIAPFFIVRDVSASITFYRDGLGFDLLASGPPGDVFYALLERGGAQVLVKAVAPDVPPLPNHERHEWAPWDAYAHVQDPDALARELAARGVAFHVPLGDREDELRGFEVKDPDGYVIFFGRPV